MPQMGAQGGRGQQSDAPDEHNDFPKWSWAAVGFAQISKMSFPAPVALDLPICTKGGHDAPDDCPKRYWAAKEGKKD